MKLEVDIRKKLRDFTLNVNFSACNEVFSLLGASGCGKSMTLKCIAGIETPDYGKIVLNDRTLFDSENRINLPPQMRRVGYLFQNYALFPNMTVAENILFAAVGLENEKLQRMKEVLSRFELDGLENSYPNQLSGGQQQRVAFARVLISHAEILLLDEPFSALDNFLKWRLELQLDDILNLYDNTAIFVSHDRDEVFRLSDKIAVMDRGKIVETNSKYELFKNPKTVSAAILTGCKNISTAKKIDDRTILAEDWQLILKMQKKIPSNVKFVGIHSNALEIVSAETENTFAFEVTKEIEDTSFYIIMIRAGISYIRLELPKKNWKSFKTNKILVRFPYEKIVLMNG